MNVDIEGKWDEEDADGEGGPARCSVGLTKDRQREGFGERKAGATRKLC